MGITYADLYASAKEEKARLVESCIALGKGYHFEKQDELLDEKARLVNIMDVKELRRKLEAADIQTFFTWNGKPGSCGLNVMAPTFHGGDWKYVCEVQQPYMPEWSVLKLGEYGTPHSWKYKGWRTVIVELLMKGREVTSEEKLHEVFGMPCSGQLSERYLRNLYNLRNRRREEQYQ